VSAAVLFTETEIETRVNAIAHAIARAAAPPEIIVPVLVGAFVFAADLARALSRQGLDLPVEFLWLASYGGTRGAGEMRVRVALGEAVRGKHVLLVDGVLDHGRTLTAARNLLVAAGAPTITTAVVIDKCRTDAPFRADHACFRGVEAFAVGYGMDDAGFGRGRPDIAKAD